MEEEEQIVATPAAQTLMDSISTKQITNATLKQVNDEEKEDADTDLIMEELRQQGNDDGNNVAGGEGEGASDKGVEVSAGPSAGQSKDGLSAVFSVVSVFSSAAGLVVTSADLLSTIGLEANSNKAFLASSSLSTSFSSSSLLSSIISTISDEISNMVMAKIQSRPYHRFNRNEFMAKIQSRG